MKIDKYEFPDDLLYDKEHNWARIEGGVATIGMTDFGQTLAGEIVYAETPRVGREIKQGDPFMSLESGKWVGRVKAIVTGKITKANEDIEFDSTSSTRSRTKAAGSPRCRWPASRPACSRRRIPISLRSSQSSGPSTASSR